MSDTFRQAVENILGEITDDKYQLTYFTDRILAAHNAELDRIADNLPSTLTSLTTGWDTGQYYEQVKAYIQAQKGI